MARQTRQDRRAQRAQQPALAGGPPPRTPAPPTANGEAQPERKPRGAEHERRSFPARAIGVIQESIGELKKVEWPNQQAVISGTAVVLVACVIVGTFLWVNDEVWKYVVKHVLLR